MTESEHARDIDRYIMQDPLATLAECGGYYECPRDANGNPAGPLVGYAGKDPETGKNYVGFVYANFAKAEQRPAVMNAWSWLLVDRLEPYGPINVFLGAPMGGIITAVYLADQLMVTVAFAEKKLVAAGEGGQRAKEQVVIGRHDIEPGSRVVIVEDVCNNFSTTADMIRLVREAGAVPVAVACLLNRSRDLQVPSGEESDRLPVVPLVHHPFDQYRQDDPAVSDMVAAGNVVWKPKIEWDRLAAGATQAGRRP